MNNILSVFIEQWEIFDEQLKTRALASVEYENKTYADVDELCIDLGLSNDETKQCKIVFVYTNSIEKALNKQSRENFINKKAEEYEYGKSLPSLILNDEAFIDDYYKLDNNIRHMLYGHIYTDFDEDKAIRYCIGALYAEINREDLVNIFGEYVVEEAEYDIVRESISDEDYEIYHTIFNATCRLQDILKLDDYDVYAIGRLFVDSEESDYEVRSGRIKLCKDYVATIKHKTVDLEARLRTLYTDEIMELAYEQAIGSCGYKKELLNEVSAKLKDAIIRKIFVLDIGFSDKELQALNTAITINILNDWDAEELSSYIRQNLQLVYAENKKDISKVRHVLGYILDSYEVTKIENEITLSIKNYGKGWVKVLKTDLGIHLTTNEQNTDKLTSETNEVFSNAESKQKKENLSDLKDSTKSFMQMLKKSKIYDPNTGKIKAYNRILTFYNKADKGKLLRVNPDFIADMLNNTNWKADNVGILRHVVDEEIFFRLNFDSEDICVNRYFRYLSDFSNNRKKILLAILPIIYGYEISDKVIKAYRNADNTNGANVRKGKMITTLKVTPNIPEGNKELIEKYLDTKGYESLRFAVNGSASYEGIVSYMRDNSFVKISHREKFELHELLSSLSRQELLSILRDLRHYKYLATDLAGVNVILGRAMVRYKIFDVDILPKNLTFSELGEYLLCLLYYARVAGSADIQVPTEN